jgi:hypothetical protein
VNRYCIAVVGVLATVSSALIASTAAQAIPPSSPSSPNTSTSPRTTVGSKPAAHAAHKLNAASLAAFQAAPAPSRAIPLAAPATSARAPHLATSLYQVAGLGTNPAGTVPVEKDGRVLVTVTGSAASAATRAVGAQVLAEAGGQVSVAITPKALTELASSAGVNLVQPSHRAYVQSACTAAQGNGQCTEGIAKSNADAWQSPGNTTGAGVKVGIVDASFGSLSAEVTAGNLPTGLTVAGNHCGSAVDSDNHGTAVAEIVHQMAPDAQLFLYCVLDNVGFAQAETELAAAGVTIVNSSLGFVGDSRGDGTGLNDPAPSRGSFVSTALTVEKARKAGILWIQSAGNSAQDHWTGSFTDANNDHYVDLLSASQDYDLIELAPGTSGFVSLTWDNWPSSNLPIGLAVDEYYAPLCSKCTDVYLRSLRGTADPTMGSAPFRGLSLVNNTADTHDYTIRVGKGTGTVPKIRYDLTYVGDVTPSLRADPTFWGAKPIEGNPARGASGSVLDPAASPYAVAVGAQYWNGGLEDFSSRGPTIDGRVKPDLLGYDGTSSNIYGPNNGTPSDTGGFFGTSAAAPHVVGAAALVKQASPSMDASQIQAFLEARATPNANPPDTTNGHGPLTLGAASGIAPDEGALFTPMDPIRVLDTRGTTGGHFAKIQPNEEVTVTPPVSVPSDATAVMINLAGVGATGPAFLSAYPNSYSGVSNVDLSKADPTLAVAATVALNTSHQFKLRASVTALDALVDVVGYYQPASSASGVGFHALTPKRILDTRYATGGHHRAVIYNEQLSIQATGAASGVPSTATAVVLNLTAVNVSRPGFLSVFPTTFNNTSTLDYGKYTMANLATVQLATGPSPAAGTFQLLNRGPAVNAIVDIVGYFDASATSQFHVLPSPVRIADTRTGNGGRYSPLPGSGSKATLTLDVAGVGQVPLAASAVWVGVIAVPTSIGYLTVYPAGQAKPVASTVDFTSGRAIANAAVTGLQSGDCSITESGGATNAVADLFGYFLG